MSMWSEFQARVSTDQWGSHAFHEQRLSTVLLALASRHALNRKDCPATIKGHVKMGVAINTYHELQSPLWDSTKVRYHRGVVAPFLGGRCWKKFVQYVELYDIHKQRGCDGISHLPQPAFVALAANAVL
jgi:hypothetical protein